MGIIRELTGRFGPPNREIPLHRFLEDARTFLTKSGDCGVLLEAGGIDPDCMGQNAIDHIAGRMESAYLCFDERTLFQEIYFRHEATGLSRSNCGNDMLDRVTASRMAHLKQ